MLPIRRPPYQINRKGESMKPIPTTTAFALLVALVIPSVGSATTHETSPLRTPEETLTEGEVRKVDKGTKKLTIRHGPIANLDMPPMTMVFQVSDASVLDAVKAGDKIRFRAEKAGGVYTVTQLEIAN